MTARTRNTRTPTNKPEIKARKPRARTIHAVKVVEEVPLSERIGEHIDCAASKIEAAAVLTVNTACDAACSVFNSTRTFLAGIGKGFQQHRAQRVMKGN